MDLAPLLYKQAVIRTLLLSYKLWAVFLHLLRHRTIPASLLIAKFATTMGVHALVVCLDMLSTEILTVVKNRQYLDAISLLFKKKFRRVLNERKAT